MLMAKILITTIQVDFVMNPSEAEIRHHKWLTWIVAIKIIAINLYHYSYFLAAPLISLFFETGYFKQGRTFFCYS